MSDETVSVKTLMANVQSALAAARTGKEALTAAEVAEAQAVASRVVKFDELRVLQETLDNAKLALKTAVDGLS